MEGSKREPSGADAPGAPRPRATRLTRKLLIPRRSPDKAAGAGGSARGSPTRTSRRRRPGRGPRGAGPSAQALKLGPEERQDVERRRASRARTPGMSMAIRTSAWGSASAMASINRLKGRSGTSSGRTLAPSRRAESTQRSRSRRPRLVVGARGRRRGEVAAVRQAERELRSRRPRRRIARRRPPTAAAGTARRSDASSSSSRRRRSPGSRPGRPGAGRSAVPGGPAGGRRAGRCSAPARSSAAHRGRPRQQGERPLDRGRGRRPRSQASSRSRSVERAHRPASSRQVDGLVKVGSVGSVTSWSRSQPSFSSLMCWIATALALASRSGSAWYSETQQR